MHQSAPDRLDPKTLILIWDTGASASLTPFLSDFIDYVKCDIDVRDITEVNKVVGIGTTLYRFVDIKGNVFIALRFLPPFIDRCPFVFSPDIPSTSW